MNLQDVGTVFGMIVVALGGSGTAGNFYLNAKYIAKADPAPYNEIYVLISSQNLKLLYDAEDELLVLESIPNPTNAQIARIATLKERIRNLKK